MYFSKADQEVKINFLTGFIFVESLLYLLDIHIKETGK
ncbi:MAG: hypothetical protein PWP30_457 [Eubacteriaceae bacterium]|jgi:hypothetical protein|nr:hypothetical protein [Eubacteriaceae bacterium]